MAALIAAVDGELTSTLLRYSASMPMSLITAGKFALAAPGKVMAVTQAGGQDQDQDPDPHNLPRWPLLVLLSCQAASPPASVDAWRQALPAAVAVEIAMAAADLLDELADDDPSPFVREYGVGQALNTGNLMLVMAQQTLLWSAQAGVRGEGLGVGRDEGPGNRDAAGRQTLTPNPSPLTPALLALGALQDMLVQAAIGQHLDMLYDRMGAGEVTLEMSVEMTALKAGALVSGACRMGALMSGAEDRVVDILARFGKELGSIAQLANDIQDVLPSSFEGQFERKTDLRQRKRTIPIVFTLRDDAPEPNAVQRAFRDERAADVDEEELRQAVVAAGGVQFASLISEVHRQHALEALEELEALRPGARAILAPLVPEDPADG
jgi:geranylgeranyl pyrophosphate synthase